MLCVIIKGKTNHLHFHASERVNRVELYQEILAAVLAKEKMEIHFPNLKISPAEIVESESYQALQKIKAVIMDDSLTDSECFMKIEEIICIFEKIGSSGGPRHDFG